MSSTTARDPTGLAAFYSALLGLPITYRSVEFVVVARDDRIVGVRVPAGLRTIDRRTGPIRSGRSRSIWT